MAVGQRSAARVGALFIVGIGRACRRGVVGWLSARDDDKILIYNTENFAKLGDIPTESHSGLFSTSRAVRIGF